MDRKTIIVLVVSFSLMLLWPMLFNRIFPPIPAPTRTNQVATATNQFGTNIPAPLLESTSPPPAAVETRPLVTPGAPEELVQLENNDARFTVTSHGGGLKQVELKAYPAVVKCGQKQPAATNRVTLNRGAPLPALAILGGAAVQGDGLFHVTNTGTGARAEKVLPNGLRLTKDYQLSSNYLMEVKVRLENPGDQPQAIPPQQWLIGTASALGTGDDPTRLGVHWYDGKSKQVVDSSWFANKRFGCIPGIPRSEYQRGSNDVVWAAVHSQFFALALIPKSPAPELRVVLTNVGPAGASDPKASNPPAAAAARQGLQAGFIYPAATLAPHQTIEHQFYVYAGPKEYKRLMRLGDQLHNNLDLVMDYDGFWGWFAQVLLSSMNGVNALGLSYALAIIAITVIIKLLFWPLTNASTKSMKRMAALQPQMKELQAKYRDDPAKMNRKMMEFMKQNRVSPLGGCLPMLLQIPVFFGFFRMIQTAIELRGAQFLWVCDLSKPDTLFVIPGLNFPFNPLPLIMGLTMLWQARLTPPSPGMDPMQQKLMRYMPLMFLFLLYNFSAGLTLYWTVQNLLTVAQMKLTRTKTEPIAPAPAAPPAARKKK